MVEVAARGGSSVDDDLRYDNRLDNGPVWTALGAGTSPLPRTLRPLIPGSCLPGTGIVEGGDASSRFKGGDLAGAGDEGGRGEVTSAEAEGT